MLVDHVRVWQNPDDERQKVGCSTPERPTKAYIKGHTEVYKLANQKAPLQVGLGPVVAFSRGVALTKSRDPSRRRAAADLACREQGGTKFVALTMPEENAWPCGMMASLASRRGGVFAPMVGAARCVGTAPRPIPLNGIRT
eukprot:scaffold731_cov261-Pinguiococcus_pyrenoidosus.AAC.75